MASWGLTQLENRLSADACVNLFDDDNDGVADPAVVEQLAVECDSAVESRLGRIYDLDDLRANPPHAFIRLSLDYAVILSRKRHPEHARGSWTDLEESWKAELSDIRTGIAQLDTKLAPEPAANVGGMVWDGTTDEGAVAKVWLDGICGY